MEYIIYLFFLAVFKCEFNKTNRKINDFPLAKLAAFSVIFLKNTFVMAIYHCQIHNKYC